MASIEPLDFERDEQGRKKAKRNTRWKARFRTPQGRTRSKTFDTKEQARRFLEDLSSDTRRSGWVDPTLQRRRFEAWAEDWFATKAHRKPGTIRHYRASLDQYVLPAFTGARIEEIDRAAVRKWLISLTASGKAPKTVRNVHSVLVGVLELALESRAIRSNPARNQEMPKQRRLRAPMFLEPPAAKRLVAAMPAPLDLAAETMLLTGMRPAELCGLRVMDVDLARRRLIVQETVGVVAGHLVVGPTKTDKVRSIPLADVLAKKLAAHLQARATDLGRPLDRVDRVFVGGRGDVLRTDKFGNRLGKVAATVGLAGLRAYDLRHTYASMLIAGGAHPKTVQERMGHATIAITMDIYGHLFRGLEEQATAALEAMWVAADVLADAPDNVVLLPKSAGAEDDDSVAPGEQNRPLPRSKKTTAPGQARR